MADEWDNEDRADSAKTALHAFMKESGQGPGDYDETSVHGDLLCNMMHLCDREGHDFAALLDRGRNHYQCETDPRDDISPGVPIRPQGAAAKVEELETRLRKHQSFYCRVRSLLGELSNDVFTDAPEKEPSMTAIEELTSEIQDDLKYHDPGREPRPPMPVADACDVLEAHMLASPDFELNQAIRTVLNDRNN